MSRNFELLQHLGETNNSADSSVSLPYELLEPRGCPEDLPISMVASERPSSTISELVRSEIVKLVHNIFLPSPGSGGPVTWQNPLVFSGFGLGISEARLTAIASDVLSEEASSIRVCAIDSDFSNPSLHNQFNISESRGFAEALDSPEISHRLTRRVKSNLWVMCSGEPSQNGYRAAAMESKATSAV